MPDITSNTTVRYRILITRVGGLQEHLPSADNISASVVVASGASACRAEIGTMADGGPALVLTPTKQVEPNISITISDSSGALSPFTLDINVVLSVGTLPVAGTLGLDLSAPEIASQPLPPADPGPQPRPADPIVIVDRPADPIVIVDPNSGFIA